MGFFSRFQRRSEPSAHVEGLLGYYGLGDWWLTALSPAERKEIEAMWGYIAFRGHPIVDERPLTRGRVTANALSATEFLMVVSKRVVDEHTRQCILAKARELNGGDLPGYRDGKPYSVYMEQAKQLIEDGKLQQADPVVDAAFTVYEERWRVGQSLTAYDMVPPAPYWDFAVLYRKQKDYAHEVKILERYVTQSHRVGGTSDRYLERLEKARALFAQQQLHDHKDEPSHLGDDEA
jgi:hypothetical protein